MALAVVTVASGGLAVSLAPEGYGLPVEEALNGFGIAVTYVASGGLPVVPDTPRVILPSHTVPENAAVGTTVGTLFVAGTTGTPVYTLVDDAGGMFTLVGNQIKVALPLDYETATSHTISVSVSGVDPPIDPNPMNITILVRDVDEVPPVIATGSTANVLENATLALALTADESVTWSIVGGADAAKFEISGTTLRWLGNGTKDYEAPDDADANNAYVAQIRATDLAGNITNKTITVTVLNEVEAIGTPIGLLLALTRTF